MKLSFKQSRVNFLTGIAMGVLIAVLLFMSFMIRNSFSELIVANEKEAECKELGIKLENASDYLTNEIRAYVQFGDKKYFDNYWTEVNETKTRDKVIERLKQLGATSEELGFIETAKQNSDALVKIEDAAMKAVALSDFDAARKLVFDSQYEGYKETIKTPIKSFQETLNSRANMETSKVRDRLNLYIGLLILVIILIAIVIAFTISFSTFRIIRPLIKLKDGMTVMSKGDLTQNISVAHDDSEIGQLSSSIDTTGKNLKKIISSIKNVSSKMQEYSYGLDASIQGTAASVEQLSNTVEQLAAGATDQARNIDSATKQLDNLADKIDDVNKSSVFVKMNIEKSGELSASGLEAINELESNFSDTVHINNEIKDNIENLSTSSNNIGAIITVINTIAEQTNLLALNAAIEAARAGDAGRGFSVVADEIRKLADQTSRSTGEIGLLIRNIMDQIKTTKAEVDKSEIIISKTDDSLIKTKSSFSLNISNVDKSIEQLQILMEKIKSADEDKNAVINSLSSISVIAEETAAATEQISATLQEQTAIIDEISTMSSELNSISQNMSQQVDEFTL